MMRDYYIRLGVAEGAAEPRQRIDRLITRHVAPARSASAGRCAICSCHPTKRCSWAAC